MTKNCNFIEKLRETGLRPTRQRVKICKLLYNRETTFHFTINELEQKIKKQANNKISLATVYNTVHAFEKKGYLKQIPINSSETYFDTNVTDHHHFYDLKEEKLIDLENSDVGPINILKKIISTADVFIQNFRPGTIERMGLGYNQIKKIRYFSK